MTLLVVPAAFFLVLLFIYPFAFGLVLSFEPKAGTSWLSNYTRFFSDPFLYETIAKTLWLSVPTTLLNLFLAVPIAFRVRLMRNQRCPHGHSRSADHAWHGAGGRGLAELSRAPGLA